MIKKIKKYIKDSGEKMPHPPSYTDIYPAVSTTEMSNSAQMGWQPSQPVILTVTNEEINPIVNYPTEPPYGTQQEIQPGNESIQLKRF
jgi:hypothetical protein